MDRALRNWTPGFTASLNCGVGMIKLKVTLASLRLRESAAFITRARLRMAGVTSSSEISAVFRERHQRTDNRVSVSQSGTILG